MLARTIATVLLAATSAAQAARERTTSDVSTSAAQGRLSWKGQVRDGRKVGEWICARADGSAMFVGKFDNDLRLGPWAYFHADGTFDGHWLSLDVGEGMDRDRALEKLPSRLAARYPQRGVDLQRVPEPEAPFEIVAMIDAVAGGDDVIAERALLQPREACAAALKRLLRLDLATDDGWERGRRVHEAILRPICSATPVWSERSTPELVELKALTILRWHSLWEITRHDPTVWRTRFDPACNWLVEDWNRFVFADPPTPPGCYSRGRPDPADGRAGDCGRDPSTREARYTSRRRGKPDPANEALARALDWLASTQDASGAWNPANHGGDARWTLAVTAQCVLVFLAGGEVPSESRGARQLAITRGLSWLVAGQDLETGAFGPKSVEGVYQHALAALALSEGAGMTELSRLKAAAELASRYLGSRRLPDGSWPLDENEPHGDGAATGMASMALKGMRMSNIEFPAEWLSGGVNWLTQRSQQEVVARETPAARPIGLAFRDPQTESAWIIFLQIACDALPAGHDPVERQVEWLRQLAPRAASSSPGVAPEYEMAGMLAAFQAGGPLWDAWSATCIENVLASEEKSPKLAGSWPAGADCVGGRIHSTALRALTLTTNVRYPRVVRAK